MKTGAEKRVKIEEKPLKKTCEKKIKKKLSGPLCPGGPGVPRTLTFKDLLRSRVHEGKVKEETPPLGDDQEGGEREERESAGDSKRTHSCTPWARKRPGADKFRLGRHRVPLKTAPGSDFERTRNIIENLMGKRQIFDEFVIHQNLLNCNKHGTKTSVLQNSDFPVL